MWPLVLVAAGVVAYANSLAGVFTFDDIAGIVENETIRNLSTALAPPSRSEPVAGRPLVNLTFALNYAVDGLEVRGYHVFNIALHVACGLLLWALVRRTVLPPMNGDNVAGMAALVWLVHPLTTEAVNYVSQRTELMMAFFVLATLYASARAMDDGRRWLAIAVAACALGMACKETMAVAPLLVVLYDRVFLFGSLRDAMRARGRFYAALAATWILLAALIWSGPRWETAGFSTGVSAWTYALNQAAMITEYLRRVVWPAWLVHDYGEPLPLTLLQVLPQALLVLALLGLTLAGLRRRPALGLLGAAFFLLLAPTSSFVPIATEAGAERRMYLPLAALAVLFATAVWWLWQRLSPRLAPAGLAATAVLIAIPLGAATVDRNRDYASDLELWQTSLERRPHARAHRNVATLLKREGYRDEVIDHLRLALDGTHPEVRYALGLELLNQGRATEGIDELRRFLAELPHDPMAATARQFLAEALLNAERYGEAAAEYKAVVTAQPSLAIAWSNLGLALSQSGHQRHAIAAFERAVTLEPGNPVSRRNLAAVLLGQEMAAEALPHAAAAAQLNPADAAAHLLLGMAFASTGRLDEARAELQGALERDPSLTEAREALAAVQRAGRAGPLGKK